MQFHTMYDGACSVEECTAQFELTADICIVGLGTAGSLAAITAAENGASVIGIDKLPLMGGTGTAANVWDYYFGSSGGRFEAINQKCFSMQNEFGCRAGRKVHPSITGIIKAVVLEEEVQRAGGRLLYETTITGIFTEDKKIAGLQIFNDTGLHNIGCKVLIDGADGFACRLAGCGFLPGRASDNRTMIFTKPVVFSNGYSLNGSWRNYDFSDVADATEWSRKLLEVNTVTSLNRSSFDQGSRVYFDSPMAARREVWNVETDVVYTLTDHFFGPPPEKPLFYGYSMIDSVNPDMENESDMLQNWMFLAGMKSYGISVPVPMGTLIAKGMDNILVAGKACGFGHELSACLRMKSDMEKIGEAAGVLAALAVRNNCSVRQVDYPELIGHLSASGCFNPAHNIGIGSLLVQDKENRLWKRIMLPEHPREFYRQLASEAPELAFWKLYITGGANMRDELVDWLGEEDLRLRENSAIALGMIDDRRALPELRAIIQRPPVISKHIYEDPHPFGFFWLERSIYCRFSRAICLLGRFADTQSLAALRSLIEDEGKAAAACLTLDTQCPDRDFYAHEFTAFAEKAVTQIENNR